LSGIIRLGVVATTSMQRQERQVIEPDALDVTGDVFLLLGYDYDQALARTGAGSLEVKATPAGIAWRTAGRLARTAAMEETRTRARAGLLAGVVPGFVETDTVMRDGIKVVRAGVLCEINLVGRPTGDGSTFSLSDIVREFF